MLQESLDSAWARDVTYGLVALLAIAWAAREHLSERRRELDWWPRYWMLTALVLLTMGIARAGALGDWLADFGREQARSEGWYDDRRRVQALAVATVSIVWLISVFVSVWRIPPRRRRYLPNVLSLSALVLFAVVRLISLHHIDAVLYRRGIGEVRFVSIFELGLLGLVAATTVLARTTHSPEASSVGASRIPAGVGGWAAAKSKLSQACWGGSGRSRSR